MMLYQELKRFNEAIEPFKQIAYYILHPLELLEVLGEYLLIILPLVAIIIFTIYIMTKSKKVLNAFYLTFVIFAIIEITIITNTMWILVSLIIAIMLIRLTGVMS